MKAIHGTDSSIARVQSALRKQPGTSDAMTPMDSIYGIPFVIHETELQAKEAAFKQAITERCKVILVEHDKFYEIDGEAMARRYGHGQDITTPYVFYNPTEPMIKVQP